MRANTMPLSFVAAMMLTAPGIAAESATAESAADRTAIADGLAGRGVPDLGIQGRGGSGDIERPGLGTFFAAVIDGTNATNVFRFFNAGRTAGTVTATIYDAAAGTSLGVWTSTSIPALGAIEVSAATIAASATPALTATQRAAALNIAVTATFRGTAQQITRTASAVVNQSDCGAGGNTLGYVEGPGFTGVTGAVRIVNASAAAGTITLSLRDAATGTELGKWTSASVPAHGAMTMTSAAIAAASTPVVPASTAALNVVPTTATARLEIEHLATATASTTVSNLSAACGI